MSRYTGWLRWRIADGTPKDVVDRSRDAGRKLMGALMERIEAGGLQQGTQRQTLTDGTQLVARFDGTTPIVEIAAAGTSEAERECKGLQGHVSDPVVVQDWPAVAEGFRPEDGFGLETFWFMGSYQDRVYLLYRSPHPAEPKSYVFAPATPALKTYVDGYEYPRSLMNPVITYRDSSIGKGPLMTSPPSSHTIDGSNFVFKFPITNLDTKDLYTWTVTLTQTGGLTDVGIGLVQPPIMLNVNGAGSGQANVVPLFVNKWVDSTLVGQGIALLDYKKRDFHGPVPIPFGSLTRGASIVGLKNRRLYVSGYGDENGPTDDEYIIDFDTGHTSHRHLSIAGRAPRYAQVCDTIVMVGLSDSYTHVSGDVWLYKLGHGFRKIGTVPELEQTFGVGDIAYAFNFTYLVPVSNKVYLFTPVMDYPGQPDVVTKYRVRVIT